MKRITIMAAALLLLMMIVSCSQNNDLVYPNDTDARQKEGTTYERIYYDDDISEDFDPANDYLYLTNPLISNTPSLMRVNPYSCRTNYICTDPLCNHDSSECPMYMYSSMTPFLSYNNRLYYCRGTDGWVDGFNGYTNQYEKMPGNVGYGIAEYDLTTKKITYLLDCEDRYEAMMSIESMVIYGNRLYYTDPVEDSNVSRGYKTILFYIDLDTGKIHNLGDYLGYGDIIISGGYIWNRAGFLTGNENPLWDEKPDKILITDLENQNPRWVDIYDTPVDDVDGYAYVADETNGALYLPYCGSEYPIHVYKFPGYPEYIKAYSDGKIYYAVLSNSDILYTYNLITGETEVVIDTSKITLPEEIHYVRLWCVYKTKYAIYECLGAPSTYSSVGKLYYYMRIDLETGGIAYIYGPE